MDKIKFAVLDVVEGLKIVETDSIKWTTLCFYLHEGYLNYEHPTNLEGIWMLEDDSYSNYYYFNYNSCLLSYRSI